MIKYQVELKKLHWRLFADVEKTSHTKLKAYIKILYDMKCLMPFKDFI